MVILSQDQTRPFILSGTFVAKGSGTMLVTQVGVNSEWGQLLANLENEDETTPLQDKLNRTVRFSPHLPNRTISQSQVYMIAKIAVVVFLVVLTILLVYWGLDYATFPYRKLIRCTPPPLNGSKLDPASNVSLPYWLNGSLHNFPPYLDLISSLRPARP